MNLKNLFFTSLTILGLAACSNNDILDQNDGVTEQGDAYAAFTINLGDQLSTRSNMDQEDVGTPEEQVINNVQVVMYADGRVKESQDFAITSKDMNIEGDGLANQDNNQHSLKKFTTKAIEVKKQNYQVVILVNPTQRVLSQVYKGSPFANLESALKNVNASQFTEKGFMMSNAQGVVNLLASDLKSTKNDAEKNPLKVQVDRVVAKVSVSTAEDLKNEHAKVSPKGWILDIKNKSTYPIRHLAPIYDGSYEVVNHKDPIHATPRAYRYAMDPNFTAIPLSGKTFNERVEELSEHFEYHNDPTFDDTTAKKVNEGFDYVLENTFDEGENNVLQSQATRVILKAGYTPNILGIEEGDDWLSYAGIPMSVDMFKEAVKIALQLSWNESIEGLTPSFTNEIKNMVFLSAYLQGLDESKEEDKEFLSKYGELNIVSFTNLEVLNKIIEDATPVGSGSIANIKLTEEQINEIGIEFKMGTAFSISNLNYYEGGNNYYPLYIKHFKFDHSIDKKNAYGKYGVVRNNFYKIRVDNIKRPGMPIITPPVGPGHPTVPTTPVDPKEPKPIDPDPETPEKPIDSEEIWVSYEVEILPWLVREQVESID